MKAYLVKDDEFKTVGFQVENNNGHALFSWGIDHSSPFYYSKYISPEDYIETIVELIETKAKLDEYGYEGHHFVSLWFQIANEGNYLKKGVEGVKMTQIDEIVKRLDDKLKRLIDSIK